MIDYSFSHTKNFTEKPLTTLKYIFVFSELNSRDAQYIVCKQMILGIEWIPVSRNIVRQYKNIYVWNEANGEYEIRLECS